MYWKELLFASLVTLMILKSAYSVLVKTPLGPVKGLELTDPDSGKTVYEFRGIRYAKAPRGDLRFRKPESVEPWTEEYDATEFGHSCPQIKTPLFDDGSDNQSEDCLFLNVYVPHSLTKGDHLSVMVWIHGGGLMIGNGNFYDGTRLAVDGNVIVVTINYRLGLLGFLRFPNLDGRGNYGFWDQIAALQWVQDNIADFRGNPESVTIFGESAGGWSVSYLTLIPSNKGLFHRAIAQSGVASRFLLPGAKGVSKVIRRVSEVTSCPSDHMDNFVDCLRMTNVNLLLNASDLIQYFPKDKFFVEFLFGPSIDGVLFPDHPIKLLEDSTSPQSQFFSSLDFITGTTSQEGSLLYMSITPKLQELYSFNTSRSIPGKFLCEALIKPFVDYYQNGDKDVQTAMCNFYTSDGSEDDQSNRATDFYGDMIFNPWAADMLDYHTRLKEGKTYQYQISKLSLCPLGYPMIPPPVWFKGVGHLDELMGLFHSKNRKSLFNATLSEDYKQFSRTMVAYWTSFAKTGVPFAGKSNLPWLEYDTQRRIFMDFDDEAILRQNWKSAMNKFWSEEVSTIPINDDSNFPHDEL